MLRAVTIAICLLVPARARADELAIGIVDRSDAEAHAGIGGSTELDEAAAPNAGIGVTGWLDGSAVARYRESSSFARATASVTARLDNDGPGITAQHAGAVRPYAFELFQLELGDRLALDVRPSLSDRPDRWRRRYRRAGFDINVIGLQYIGARWGVQLIRVDNGADWETQHDAPTETSTHRFVSTASWAPLSITRRKDGEEIARFDPIAIEATAISGQRGGAVMTVFYPRLAGIAIGGGTLDVAFGEAMTATETISVNNQVVSTIDSARFPKLHARAGRARLVVPAGAWSSELAGERSMFVDVRGGLVLEERGTWALATRVGEIGVRGSAFAAHSRIWTSMTDSTAHVTGGAGLALEVPLHDRWQLATQLEVARTFYASVEGDLAPRVDTAVRFELALRRELRAWGARRR